MAQSEVEENVNELKAELSKHIYEEGNVTQNIGDLSSLWPRSQKIESKTIPIILATISTGSTGVSIYT